MSSSTPVPHRSLLAKVFISPNESRPRAGWRLLLQFILFFLVFILVIILLSGPLLSGFERSGYLLEIGLQASASMVSVWLARRWFDKRSFVSLGLKLDSRTLIDTLVGILIAAITIGLIFLAEFAFGWLTIEGVQQNIFSDPAVRGDLLVWLLSFLIVGFYEELESRGYRLQNLEDGLNTFWAVLISSLLFSIAHLINPNPSWMSILGIFLAGLFMSYAYLRTRQLWLAVGIHIGWNFFEGPIFGFPVSGLETFRFIQTTVSGPELLTGGAFGPEAGLLQLPALAIGVLLIYLYTRSRQTGENQNDK
jgi:membrane protease YdiL (CAAX protease family)